MAKLPSIGRKERLIGICIVSFSFFLAELASTSPTRERPFAKLAHNRFSRLPHPFSGPHCGRNSLCMFSG